VPGAGGDRVPAARGRLDDATPVVRAGRGDPHAGVGLARPPRVGRPGVWPLSGAIAGRHGPAGSGRRPTLVAVLLLAWLRITRPESLQAQAPVAFGRRRGVDRAPEVTTGRPRRRRVTTVGRAAALGRALADRRGADRGAARGARDVDGHGRGSPGPRTLPNAPGPRMGVVMPAPTTDRKTAVFDQGGDSPTRFRALVTDGVDLLTYHSGRIPGVRQSRFGEHAAVIPSALAGSAARAVTDPARHVVLHPLRSPHRGPGPSPRAARTSPGAARASPVLAGGGGTRSPPTPEGKRPRAM